MRGRGALAALAAAALVAAALVAGCGGSGHPATGSSTTAMIGRTAFIARADSICKAAQAALAPVLARETATLEAKPPKREAAAQALQQASAIVARGRARLRALPQPAAQRALLATVYRALGEEAGSLHSLSADVKAGKQQAMSTDAAEQTAFATLYSGAAVKYGFKSCGAQS